MEGFIIAIFDEETINAIQKMKLQVDAENEIEIQRRQELLEFTIQALKEFPEIATRIGLKKLGSRYDGDTKKYGWGLFFQQLDDGSYYLMDYPKYDARISDEQIKGQAAVIRLYFKSIEAVREMIIAALTGRPIAPKK